MTICEAQSEGERRKREGMDLAAMHKQRAIRCGQLAMLAAGLSRQSRTCSANDMPDDLGVKYANGGKWVGSAVLGLSRCGITEKAGHTESLRPARHCGDLKLWRIIDVAKAAAFIRQCRDWLARNPPPEPSPETPFDYEPNKTPGAGTPGTL
ncbi:MAG: hypothetical protein IT446_02460 [Phycisphaerales bacterium]|nr:hypothetical protein [Phycisphaerales bacterium]